MPSRAQRKRQKKVAANQRFLAATRLKLSSLLERQQPKQQVPGMNPSPSEPKILDEDVGKLASIGVSQATVTYLRKGGAPEIRDIPRLGRARLLEMRGLGEARVVALERALSPYGVTIPA